METILTASASYAQKGLDPLKRHWDMVVGEEPIGSDCDYRRGREM